MMFGLSIIVATGLGGWFVANAIERRVWLNKTMAANALKACERNPNVPASL